MVKKIHYCWFGGKKLPKSVEDCIKTWKKFLPDYEIKQWNESNFDVNSFPFVKEAYESKKWAFVSDYVRIYALYNEGGLYLDTDVKILKDPTDVLNKEVVLGYEDSGYVGTAMIYAQNPQNKYIKAILDYYGKIVVEKYLIYHSSDSLISNNYDGNLELKVFINAGAFKSTLMIIEGKLVNKKSGRTFIHHHYIFERYGKPYIISQIIEESHYDKDMFHKIGFSLFP